MGGGHTWNEGGFLECHGGVSNVELDYLLELVRCAAQPPLLPLHAPPRGVILDLLTQLLREHKESGRDM